MLETQIGLYCDKRWWNENGDFKFKHILCKQAKKYVFTENICEFGCFNLTEKLITLRNRSCERYRNIVRGKVINILSCQSQNLNLIILCIKSRDTFEKFDLVIIIRKLILHILCRKYGKGGESLWERAGKNKETRRNVNVKSLKRPSFPQCVFLPLLLKIRTVYASVCFWAILFHWSLCLLLYQYHTFLITIDLQYTLKSRIMIPLPLFFLLKITLAT